MSKELEAFGRVQYALNNADELVQSNYEVDDLDIIETALKRLEQYENETQSIGEMIVKNLKALEIIKEKNVNCDLVRQTKNVREYNKSLGGLGVAGARHFNLIQEEFDLLKEVLK